MNRESIFVSKDGETTTFEKDDQLPSLPLPKLEDTLNRYYETLKPFGTAEELKTAQRAIEKFKSGIGKELHKELELKATNEKNWVERWWEDYAYHSYQMPLYPYIVMAMPLLMQSVGVPETRAYALKAAARCMYHTLEYWDLLRRERLKPASSPDGSIMFSSALFRRFFATSRLPGEKKDRIETHFKTLSEGGGPSHLVVTVKGRIFTASCFNSDGTILSQQQLLILLQRIRAVVDYEDCGDGLPVLTCDERNLWSKNRQHLMEISQHNKRLIQIMESSILTISLDEHEPSNYSESAALALTGDCHSRWADRSSVLVIFKNGKISCIGEHSAYDGTISIHYGLFILLSLMEKPEADWDDQPTVISVPMEQKFELDEHLRNEVNRVKLDCIARRNNVTVVHEIFDGYGKEYMKSQKLHPDAFIQMVLQLAYYRMHNETAATYETALMRQYYNGRTETLRSCTGDSVNFVKTAMAKKSSDKKIAEAFRKAVNTHNKSMSEARKGNGVDRHLFGLWCVAYEKGLDIPELYSDPLYLRSGGGGNFVLSTSTLGFTINTGFVAPMVQDGYGIFYSITSEAVNIITTAYSASSKTSAHKFVKTLTETLMDIKGILDNCATPKL